MILYRELFRKPSSEIVTAAYIKKGLAKSKPIFNRKRPGLSSQDWFLYREEGAVHSATSARAFKWLGRNQDGLPSALFLVHHLNVLFSLSDSEVGTSSYLIPSG
jgi:hypothetical protein